MQIHEANYVKQRNSIPYTSHNDTILIWSLIPFQTQPNVITTHVLTSYIKSSDQTNSIMGVVYLVRVFYWNELYKVHVDKS